MPFPNPASQFKPGQSGNPNGYSRGRRTTDALLRVIDQMGADDAIAKRWLKAILDGDFRYFKEFLDRTEGKSPETVTITTSQSLPPDANTRKQAANILRELGLARNADPVVSPHSDESSAGVSSDR